MRPFHWSRDKKLPPIGLEIYDSKAMNIGKISDIIGPVFKPYFKIKPSRPNLSFSSMIGEPLYTMPDSRGKEKMATKSKFKGKNMRDGRQNSNKFLHGKQPSTRNYSKTSKPRDKTSK